MSEKNKRFLPAAIIFYLNYFIHGVGCSVLGQQSVKEALSGRWGVDVMAVTSIAAALGLGRLISLPFAGPLSDKLGRKLSVIIGCFSYVIFLVGIAFAPNTGIAYICAVMGGIANSFLDTATYPGVTEIFDKATGIATMGIKFFISISQLLMPFFIGVAVGSAMGVTMLPLVFGIAIGVIGVLAIFTPFPGSDKSDEKGESFLESLKNANFTLESVACILIGFTCTATFQLWLNCAQTFAKEVAGVAAESASIMQTYYSAGSLVALVVTSFLITRFKQVRFLVIYPAVSVVMLLLVYMIRTPFICYVGAFVIGYAAAGGVLQMATAVVNDLFPHIKGTITSLVMIASSLCNYTILTAASKMTASNVIIMNLVITIIGVLLAVFVNLRYDKLLEQVKED